ncbi:MAG: aminoacyl-histidine dipeptidase [Oscillospiraceae bacterium]|nr:aminoacyl-histidine dipeptidase [Oscillospiraceae bacterium]
MNDFVLTDLGPKSVFHFFEELARIPHGSGNTAAASAWAEDFAKARGLRYRRDALGNVVIWRSASPGYEDHPAVILQGHLDMVCVQESGLGHDFEKDPLELEVQDGWVKARGTTLGGDNGIAVAMILALLDDETAVHPPIEAVLTVDEEVGLLGANGLDCSDLQGRRLINLDSEDEGVLTVSCAGGSRCDILREYPVEEAEGAVCTLAVSGGRGGHSGMEIHKGLTNANKLLGACLQKVGGVRLISLSGGMQDNAIPKEAEAVFLAGDADVLASFRQYCENGFDLEVNSLESGLHVKTSCVQSNAPRAALSREDSQAVLSLLDDCPNGVQAMSRDIPGLVQTSLNLGILRLEEGRLSLSSAVRSSVAAEQEALCARLEDLAAQYGGSFSRRGAYPPWEYRKDSPLRDVMLRVWRETAGKEMQVEAIHAGLECGLFAGKIPGLDAVSIGPDLRDVHSTRERMSIASVQRTWDYLRRVLEEL